MYAHSISGRSRIYNDRTVIHKVEAYVYQHAIAWKTCQRTSVVSRDARNEHRIARDLLENLGWVYGHAAAALISKSHGAWVAINLRLALSTPVL